MSAPVIHDPAVTAISVVIDSLADAFDPASSFPPEHGSRQVRFFAGEAPATATFNAHSDQAGCGPTTTSPPRPRWTRSARKAASSAGPPLFMLSSTRRRIVMSRIVVEGSVTPCVELERGERAEVEHTDHVQRLIDSGYVIVVGDAPNGEPEPTQPPKTRRAREPKLPEQSTAQS